MFIYTVLFGLMEKLMYSNDKVVVWLGVHRCTQHRFQTTTGTVYSFSSTPLRLQEHLFIYFMIFNFVFFKHKI